MGDELEAEEEVFEFPARKMDKLTLVSLYLQYRAHKKLVKGDFYVALSDSILLHRQYKDKRTEFQESASREIEALVTAVEGVNRGSTD